MYLPIYLYYTYTYIYIYYIIIYLYYTYIHAYPICLSERNSGRNWEKPAIKSLYLHFLISAVTIERPVVGWSDPGLGYTMRNASSQALTHRSMFLLISDTSTFPLTMSAQARYRLRRGSALISWWLGEKASENI